MGVKSESPRAGGRSVLSAALVVEAVALGLALLLGRVLATPPFASYRFTPAAVVIAGVALVPLVAFAQWSLRSPARFFEHLRGVVFDKVVPMLQGSSTLALLAISVAAGVCEEALFRGVLQTALAGAIGPLAALGIVSALFGLLHPVSAAYMVLAGVLGAYLGGLLLATGNLFIPIAVHAAYDFVGLTLLMRASRLADQTSVSVRAA